jgi:hypothetical protein
MKFLKQIQILIVTTKVILLIAIPSILRVVKPAPITNIMRKLTELTKALWKKNRHITIIRPRNTWSTAKNTIATKIMKRWIIVIIAGMTSDTANTMPP